MAVTHICLRGNFYGELTGGPRGSLDQIVPRHPDRVTVDQQDDGKLVYKHRPDMGQERTIPAEQMWHVKLFSLDGINGVTPTTYARNAIGLSVAQETHGASQFKNGLIPPFYISRPPGTKFLPEARKNFRDGWRAMHAGPENAANPPILEDGMELKALGVTNEDSQWLESRKFQTVEIARIHRVPLFLINDLDRATFSNIDEQFRAFIVLTMLSWVRRFEQTGARDLIADPEQFFLRYNYDALLRGDVEKRATFYRAMFGMGVFSTNDICELEDRNGIGPDGDQRFIDGNNLVPIDQAGRVMLAEPEPPTPPAAPDAPQPKEDEARSPDVSFEVSAVVSELCQDAAARIVAAEVRTLKTRAGKAADDRGRWNAWAMAKLDKHCEYIEKALAPIAAVGQPGADVARIARLWCDRQGGELIGTEDVAGTLDSWNLDKPAELAALLNQELMPCCTLAS